jgi:hypothetical protein
MNTVNIFEPLLYMCQALGLRIYMLNHFNFTQTKQTHEECVAIPTLQMLMLHFREVKKQPQGKPVYFP